MAELASGELLRLGALGLVFLILLLGGIYFMATREVFSSSGNRETASERAENQDLQERSSFEIPLRSRISSYSGPTKAVAAASALVLGFVGYLVYRLAQTGSPAESVISLQLVMGVVALAGIIGGARLRKWASDRVGVMYNVYEQANGEPEVERVEYFKHERQKVGQQTVIQQLHPQRLLGVFRRRLLIGSHRDLRSSPKPLSDVVTHAVPDGEHAYEVDDGVIINQTRGDPVLNTAPDAAADVSYRSPQNLSYERAVGIQQSKQRMRIERDAWQTTAAAKDAELDRLSDMIVNREWESKQDLMDLLREYEDMQRQRDVTVQDNRESGIKRSATSDGSSVLQEEAVNGDGGDADA